MKTKKDKITLDAVQEKALESMLSGKNILLFTHSGSGGTEVLKEFVKNTDKNVLYLSQSGQVKQNIHAQILHVALGFPTDFQGLSSIAPTDKEIIDAVRNIDVIILDNASAIRSDLFKGIDTLFRKCYDGKKAKEPFAGKQICICGDLLGCTPLMTEYERNYIIKDFGGVSIFESTLFHGLDFQTFYLKSMYRQQNDLQLQKVLKSFRNIKDLDNLVTLLHEDYENVNKLEDPFKFLNKQTARKLHKDVINICPNRSAAKFINSKIIATLLGKAELCKSSSSSISLMNDCYTLKESMRVILTANRYKSNGDPDYSKGEMGTLINYIDGRFPVAIIKRDNGEVIEVRSCNFHNYEFYWNSREEKFTQYHNGIVHQLPILPAYAISINDIMGKTLNEKYNIFYFDPSVNWEVYVPRIYKMLYTALALGTSLSSIRIDREYSIEDFDINEDLLKSKYLNDYIYPRSSN